MKALGILFVVLLIGTAGFTALQITGARHAAGERDRCAEATPGAWQAFEAGPAGRAGLRLEELGPGQRAEMPEATRPGLVLCRAEARFGNGARDTMWFALLPTADDGRGRFVVHAAPGDLGRRSVLAVR